MSDDRLVTLLERALQLAKQQQGPPLPSRVNLTHDGRRRYLGDPGTYCGRGVCSLGEGHDGGCGG